MSIVTQGLSAEEQGLHHATEEAFRVHAGQFVTEQAVPYIAHPMNVLAYIADWNVRCWDIRKAAVLHEALHPAATAPLSFQAVADVHGERVAEIIRQCTFVFDPGEVPMDDPEMQPIVERIRQQQLVEHHRSFYRPTTDIGALLVKVADVMVSLTDVLATNPGEAARFFKQHQDLWDALKTRQPEIELGEDKGLGLDVWARMRYHLTELNQRIY